MKVALVLTLVFLLAAVQVSSLDLGQLRKTLGEKIKHVVVLMEENRSFDHLLGWYGKEVNGLNGTEYNLKNCTDPSSAKVFVNKGAPYVNFCDPNHGTPATTFKIFGPLGPNGSLPTMEGFATYEFEKDHSNVYCGVMDMFDTRTKLPVLTALVENFVLFDRFFASIPGPTWPNRQFFMSATSAGLTETFPWYMNKEGHLFPQATIFDQVAQAGGQWKLYYQDTPWELFMESLAHHPENMHSLDQFYADCANGTLPDFAFINPRAGMNFTTGEGSNDAHPDHDYALAELHYKNVYEAIRASPAWNETLFVLTFDEHGGFYDHVPPPMDIPAPNPGEPSYPSPFRFDRLGIRIPTLLISPWVAKGRVESAPPESQKPYNNSEYDLTSIIATTRKILTVLNGTGPLTNRDAWVATWEHLISEEYPRTDCPTELPAAPPPHKKPKDEAELPINELQEHMMHVHSGLMDVSYPHHITRQGDVSEWLQKRFLAHKDVTAEWKLSKKLHKYWVAVAPFKEKHHHEKFRILTDGFGRSTAWIKFKDGKFYCLDANDVKEGSRVMTTHCYHSHKPTLNHDKKQWWAFWPDSTVRPHSDQTLCMTDRWYQNMSEPWVYLSRCNPGDVTQHFEYAPHMFQFGCGSGKIVLDFIKGTDPIRKEDPSHVVEQKLHPIQIKDEDEDDGSKVKVASSYWTDVESVDPLTDPDYQS